MLTQRYQLCTADDSTLALLLARCSHDYDEPLWHLWLSLARTWKTMAPWHCWLHPDHATTMTAMAHKRAASITPRHHRSPLARAMTIMVPWHYWSSMVRVQQQRQGYCQSRHGTFTLSVIPCSHEHVCGITRGNTTASRRDERMRERRNERTRRDDVTNKWHNKTTRQ